MNKTKYEQEVEYLNTLKLKKLEEVKCGEALSTIILLRKEDKSILGGLKCLAGSFLLSNLPCVSKGNGEIALFLTPSYMGRDDYIRDIMAVAECIERPDIYISLRKKEFHISCVPGLFLWASWVWEMRCLQCSLGQKMVNAAMLLRGYYCMERAKRTFNKTNKLPKMSITFCDYHLVDYFLTWMANKMGIKTITLQHGAVNSEEKWPIENSHSSAYLAINEYERQKYRKHSGSGKAIAVGPMKYIRENTPFKDHERNGEYIGIALSAAALHEDNKPLLLFGQQLAKEYGYKAIIRCHPSLPLKKISEPIDWAICKEIEEQPMADFVRMCDIVITGASTVFVDVIGMGCPAIRLSNVDYDPYEEIDNTFVFTEYRKLKEIIKRILDDEEQIWRELKHLQRLFCPSGNIKKNYEEYFKSELGKL